VAADPRKKSRRREQWNSGVKPHTTVYVAKGLVFVCSSVNVQDGMGAGGNPPRDLVDVPTDLRFEPLAMKLIRAMGVPQT
jgi:hypothetical protein